MAATDVSRVTSILEICVRFRQFLFISFPFAPALAMLSAHAQGVTDPLAVVPATTYRSVFQGAETGVVGDTKGWREANDDVGQFKRGHIDVLKWEEQQAPARGDATTAPHGHHNPTVKKP